MSLLKDLLQSALKTALSGIESAAQQSSSQQASAPALKPAANSAVRREEDCPAYFREILKTEFPQYEVKEKVPVTDLAGYANDSFQLYKTRPYQAYKAEWGQPYTFVLQQGGQPKGIVMLGGGHTHDSNVKYLIARMYAKKMGLPYINFYTQMPNERDYVISRIHRFMG